MRGRGPTKARTGAPERRERRGGPNVGSRVLETSCFLAGLALVRAATLGHLPLARPTLEERALCEMVGVLALLGAPVLGLWVSYALSFPLPG